MNKIAIVGTSGSGKSTLAEEISSKCSIPHFQLDALYWRPNWSHVSDEEFRNNVAEVIENPQWIICGNFSQCRDIAWSKADTVVWLDYSFSLVLSRLLWRSVVRAIDKKDLWGTGNKESFRQTFLSKNSIILWMLKTYRRYQKEYQLLMADEKYSHIKFIRLKNQKEADNFISSL